MKKQDRIEALIEDMQSKFDLVLKGQTALIKKSIVMPGIGMQDSTGSWKIYLHWTKS